MPPKKINIPKKQTSLYPDIKFFIKRKIQLQVKFDSSLKQEKKQITKSLIFLLYLRTTKPSPMKNSKILVPTDFTAVAECALQHATKLAQIFDSEVILLHVVSKDKEVETAKTKLDDVIKKTKTETNINLSGMVRVGNIFDDIGDVASKEKAKIIIMGTHGAKGMQKLTGSYALKVITNSKVPFIVVQQKPIKNGYTNIVLPLNLSKDTKQKISLATEMAKYFSSKIHIITPKETDEFLSRQLKANMAYAIKHLKEQKVEFTTHVSDGKISNFAEDVLKYATANDADLISMVNFEGGGALFGTSYEQKILANDSQIPVMCINPVATRLLTGNVFTA